jgi:site-specific recombinase XerD
MDTNTTLAHVRPSAHNRYRTLPIFGRYLDDFISWAVSKNYTIHSIYLQLDAVRHLEVWFRRKGQRSLGELTEDDLSAAYRGFLSPPRDSRYASALRGLRNYLAERGYLKRGRPPILTRTQKEVSRWREYLHKDCGRAGSTVESYERHVGQLLDFIGLDRDRMAIRELTITTVNQFLCHASRGIQHTTMQSVVGSVRGFLRFQYVRGIIKRPLHLQIDTTRIFRPEQLPYPVQWNQLQKLLGSIDRSTPLGRRDYAVLLLAATYGLRASDVANLTMDAIDWRGRTIRIVQCKTRQPLDLPLTDEVGTALQDYLQHARAKAPYRQIFLRLQAPVAPLSLPGMSNTLRRASDTAGVKLQAAGFRCLRHALALRLLRQGTSLKGIGDILGHRSTTSTSQYLRLDVEDLRHVALPVPVTPPTQSSNLPEMHVPQSRRGVGARAAPREWGWRSFLGKAMQEYLAIQQALGRIYKTAERTLRGLDFFLVEECTRARHLNLANFTAWAAGLRSLCPTTARMRMLCVRKFCCHVAHSDPAMFIPDSRTFPKELPHQAPYLFSTAEVGRVLAATTMLGTKRNNPLRPKTIRLAFLLLFCCGLRHSEVLKLRLADIDVEHMVLRINESKFNKSRLVPLSPSVAKEVRCYLRERRQRNMPADPASPLVWNGYPSRTDALTSYPFWATWLRVCCRARVFDHRGRPPRLHDLRHSFAVEALRRGYDKGQNPQVVLPRLARYMGHASAQFTHYYLKFTEPLRCAAGDRFRRHLASAVLSPANGGRGGVK